MNGFGSDNSDVDMCLLVRHTEMDQRNEAVVHLEQMLKCLRRCGESLTMMWCHIPEHFNLYQHCCDNPKVTMSYLFIITLSVYLPQSPL